MTTLTDGTDHYLKITEKIGTLINDAQILGAAEAINASVADPSKVMIRTHRELIALVAGLCKEVNTLRGL